MTSNVVSEIPHLFAPEEVRRLVCAGTSHTTASCWQALRSDFITENSDLLHYVKNV